MQVCCYLPGTGAFCPRQNLARAGNIIPPSKFDFFISKYCGYSKFGPNLAGSLVYLVSSLP